MARQGLLLVDKPSGRTSHDVVAKFRKLAGLKRVGHTGTLDPLATGLLALLFGPATRLEPFLTKMDKAYEARVHLGLRTTTDDVDGETLGEHEGQWPSEERLREALAGFVGPFEQVPPAVSAISLGGVRAHKAARAGRPLDLPPRPVTAHELRILKYNPPFVDIYAKVASGFYVRSLARDLGKALGLGGGALSALRRTELGPWWVCEAVSLETVEGWGPWPDGVESPWSRYIIKPAEALPNLAAICPSVEAAARFRQGQTLEAGRDFYWAGDYPAGPHKVLGPEGQLLGLAHFVSVGDAPRGPFLRPLRVMAES